MIRKAEKKDIPGILHLLGQVNQIHADGRPDLFKAGGSKYTEADLAEKLGKENEEIIVYTDGSDRVMGYIFGISEVTEETSNTFPHKTYYIDDFCVEETARGQHIGTKLYEAVKKSVKERGYDRITLHVWACNEPARKFYDALGLHTMYTAMEEIIYTR